MFREYAEGLGFSLDFQGFEQEVATLPGEYAPPEGVLLLASVGGRAAGCVGLRPLDAETAEMKRLFVRNEFRGLGIGRRLVDRIVQEARRIGYRRLRLDTVPQMVEAIRMYQASGFVEIPPYRFNPIPGALFFELDLGDQDPLLGSNEIQPRSPPRASRRRVLRDGPRQHRGPVVARRRRG